MDEAKRSIRAEPSRRPRPKLGVITPTFNRPDKLVRLYRSLAETGRGVDWVHLVADDNSRADYRPAIAECLAMTQSLDYRRVPKGGALAARNDALDRAAARGCTHAVFIDDDDFVTGGGLALIAETVRQHAACQWFVFAACGMLEQGDWPDQPTAMSWFEDVVCDRRLGGDSLIVASMDLIGTARFPAKGSNQREWKFLLELSRKDDQILAVPQTLLAKEYQPDGLSAATRVRFSTPEAVFNNLERAFCYWRRKPLSGRYATNLLKQAIATPPKLGVYFAAGLLGWTSRKPGPSTPNHN